MKIFVEFVDLIAVEISIIVFILFNFYVQVAWTVVMSKTLLVHCIVKQEIWFELISNHFESFFFLAPQIFEVQVGFEQFVS